MGLCSSSFNIFIKIFTDINEYYSFKNDFSMKGLIFNG